MNNDLIRLRSEGCTHVIDGENSIRIAVARRLRRAGYQVRRYASIGEFLVRDTGGKFGCILTEVSFGEGPDGFALLQALSRSPDSLPVVFMSRSHNVASAVRAMKFGAIDYLNKPLKSVLPSGAMMLRGKTRYGVQTGVSGVDLRKKIYVNCFKIVVVSLHIFLVSSIYCIFTIELICSWRRGTSWSRIRVRLKL